eukprot:TRINITY_DN1319_c0_g1_i2.p1 TRINITY_DN1319_c0_g1~~TRINITY_DN1319_c0_g1_i2.p1  ORF type:complete len:682 (-),score=250.96 TRINITY_DN1319_c0_g1_i2:263-2308(-)
MFSDVQKYPRSGYRMKVDHRKEASASIQQAKFNVVLAEQNYNTSGQDNVITQTTKQQKSVAMTHATGVDRYKYFQQPVLPYLQSVQPEVVLAPEKVKLDTTSMVQRPPSPTEKTVGTQTDYRESETQTDPYTPDPIFEEGSEAELLTLTHLKFGQGLPAGQYEVEMIERARQRREFNAQLPPIDDPSTFELRRKMLEEQELREWEEREEQIKRVQDQRIELLKEAIIAREEQTEKLNEKRLEQMKVLREKEKEAAIDKIRTKRIKTFRKLAQKRQNVEGKKEKRDIIMDYADFGSKVYAPKNRDGLVVDKSTVQHQRVEQTVPNVASEYQTLHLLDQTMPLKMAVKPIHDIPQTGFEGKSKTATSKSAKQKRLLAQELSRMDTLLRTQKLEKETMGSGVGTVTKKKKRKSISKALAKHRQEKAPERPPTPEVEVPTEDEDVAVAVIHLQRLLRGRASQNIMFEGKEKRLELIYELRPEDDEMGALELEEQPVEDVNETQLHIQRVLESTLDAIQGEIVGNTLDFLAKELVRVNQEKIIHDRVVQAERERRLREALESGRRQQEQEKRQKEDELFRVHMSVHHSTVDSYLQTITDRAVRECSDSQAEEEMRSKVVALKTSKQELQTTQDVQTDEQAVQELILEFVIPEIDRNVQQRETAMEVKKYQLAAHKELVEVTKSIKK